MWMSLRKSPVCLASWQDWCSWFPRSGWHYQWFRPRWRSSQPLQHTQLSLPFPKNMCFRVRNLQKLLSTMVKISFSFEKPWRFQARLRFLCDHDPTEKIIILKRNIIIVSRSRCPDVSFCLCWIFRSTWPQLFRPKVRICPDSVRQQVWWGPMLTSIEKRLVLKNLFMFKATHAKAGHRDHVNPNLVKDDNDVG